MVRSRPPLQRSHLLTILVSNRSGRPKRRPSAAAVPDLRLGRINAGGSEAEPCLLAFIAAFAGLFGQCVNSPEPKSPTFVWSTQHSLLTWPIRWSLKAQCLYIKRSSSAKSLKLRRKHGARIMT
jgi:hypothetical protein